MNSGAPPKDFVEKDSAASGEITDVRGQLGDLSGRWMAHYDADIQTINVDEATSLSALVSFVADATNSHEFRIERMVADHFGVPNIKRLPARLYNEAVQYLVTASGVTVDAV